MNDLEREVRDTLQRHESDAPSFETSDARRVAGRAHRRQLRNVVFGGIAGAAVIVALSGLGGLVRADRSPTVPNGPSSSPTCVARKGTEDAKVHGWPSTTRNPAGVYSWDGPPARDDTHLEGFMHNGYKPGSGDVNILIGGNPGLLLPHRGEATVTLAGCEATYRRFVKNDPLNPQGPSEEWMMDIEGTTVTITLIAERPSGDSSGATEAEVAEAHEIIESIRARPRDNALGFRLIFTLPTNTWDSG